MFDDFGPRVDDMVWNIYADTDLLFAALQADEIDVADWEVSKAYATAWKQAPYNDPTNVNYIKMADVKSIGMREFDLNHKPVIDTYPSWTNPMTYKALRVAIAHLSNKPYYVNTILGGLAVELGTPIMPWTFWYNNNCSDYYTYDIALARAALDAGGFTKKAGAGPVPGAPTGSDDWRVYPTGHEKQGQLLDSLILYIRADDSPRKLAGLEIAKLLKTVGIPTTDYVLPMAGCYTAVFTDQNYHLYTGGWSLSTDPDYLYDIWGGQAINSPNFDYYNNTAFNEASARIKYAVTLNDALTGALDAQWIMTEDAGIIPLWTAVAHTAHRGYDGSLSKPWTGFVNSEGVGLANGQSYVNAHTGDVASGGTLYAGQKEKPLKLNLMRSEWYFEYSIMDRIYEPLMGSDPYSFADMPGIANSWYVGTYYNPVLGKECSMLTFNLEDDVYWHDGVKFTSADVKFAIEYYRDNKGWNWGAVQDVYDVKTPDDYTVVVLMSVKSFWALHWIGLGVPMFPKHIWETITGSAIEVAMPDKYLIGTGPFKYGGGEAGSEPGTGKVPQEYAILHAYNPTSPGYYRHCPIYAPGGVDTQGNYALPAGKGIMKRDVFAPKDAAGNLIHASLNTVVPIAKAKNLHATTGGGGTQSITWTLTKTGYSSSRTVNMAPSANLTNVFVTMTFDGIDISVAGNGNLGISLSLTHTADSETTRTCIWTQAGLMKMFLGDIDANGIVNLLDTLELSSGFSLWNNGGIYYANADITGDGLITAADGVEMQLSL